MPADQGNPTVVLDNRDYLAKMTELLEDETSYMKVKQDTTRTIDSETPTLLTDVF